MNKKEQKYAVAIYRVADAQLALTSVDDLRQAPFREAQLAFRAVLGGREFDRFLAERVVNLL